MTSQAPDPASVTSMTPAFIEYDPGNPPECEPGEGVAETFNIYVGGALAVTAEFTYLRHGKWFLLFRDLNGEPTSGTGGDMWSAPMLTLRERVHIMSGVPLTDIQVRFPGED
ncbi:hypothetical protein GCM10009733_008480 [Nonomuraea maheshkhaliensis]|uniref:Uncharacterized protein n=1 Tax=Nonomuraea maheshkhaliensis TaxID=419590 RepID=A0ABP4QNN6_9ACTN